jgi:hypothetical protein
MVEIVSWVGVALIALGALVGFTGVVATTVLTLVRSLRRTAPDGRAPHGRAPGAPETPVDTRTSPHARHRIAA